MVLFDFFFVALDSIPVVRGVFRKLIERGIEIDVIGPKLHANTTREEPKFTVAIEKPPPDTPELPPSIYCDFAIRLINHRTDRKERVIGVWIEIKKRKFLLWRETLVKVPVNDRRVYYGSPGGPKAITDVELEAMSPPIELECMVFETLDETLRRTLPRRSEIWLSLDMVGPIRAIRRKIEELQRASN